MEVDDFVGTVVDRLRQHDALDNTIVVFTSDNGGLWSAWDPVEADDVANYRPSARGEYTRSFGHQSNGELRGTKADIWEGGHRIPLIVQWPQRVRPGVTETQVELTDLFATIADILAAPLPDHAAPDSFSFYSVLLQPDTGRTARPFLVHHSIDGMFAITEGDWKFEERRGSGGFSRLEVVVPKPGEATGQLYNVRTDIRETQNLFLSQPQRVAHFDELLDRVKKSQSVRLESAAWVSARN